MTFTYNLAATGDDLVVSEIRLEIGDTEEGEGNGVKPPKLSNFSDAELLHFYSKESSSLGAAARACEVLARMWAGAGQNVKIRNYSINSTEKAGHYRGLAADLRLRIDGVITSVELDREDGYSAKASGGEYA